MPLPQQVVYRTAPTAPLSSGKPLIPSLNSVRQCTRKPVRACAQVTAQKHDASVNSGRAKDVQRWAAGLVAVPAALALACAPPAVAEPDIQGTFVGKCAGCHMNGGNILAAGASLFPEDLQRNGYADPEAMFNLIYKGKGRMPGYGKDCAPKGQCTFGPRLSDEEISGLVTYVLQRADAGWK